jgi:hypothetical protein
MFGLYFVADNNQATRRRFAERLDYQIRSFIRGVERGRDVVVILVDDEFKILGGDGRMDDPRVAAVNPFDSRADIIRVCQHQVGTVRRSRVPGPQPVKHVAKGETLRPKSQAGLLQIGELLVPRISHRTVHIAQMWLVRAGQNASRECGRRGNYRVITRDIKLFDHKRAEKE